MIQAGKIIFQGSTIKGNFLICYPAAGDAQEMCNYINTLSREQTFILFQGEEITLEAEQNYLESQLKKITSQKLVQLLAVADNRIIGISGIEPKDRVESHIASFGISVAHDWRGLGIGSKLMQSVFDEAQIQLPTVEIVTLGAFANNETAIGMYQKFGFQEFGRLPRGIIHRGNHVDHISMYKTMR